MKTMNKSLAVKIGFSVDKRKRRNQHRKAARKILNSGGFFNSYSARGTTFGEVAVWHLSQARYI